MCVDINLFREKIIPYFYYSKFGQDSLLTTHCSWCDDDVEFDSDSDFDLNIF